ncbi:GGDEF domain-containing protein [Acidovorax sp. BL-A-41-H1]|uniref:GGDEF domain-containing protein n=1 Tax=Acidovorax sp. BL-A-41-H1 TaxID=3421102 RepID=UPI003F79869D
MQNAPLPHISLWQAEFSDPAVEQAFRADVQPRMAWQLRTALWVWAALVLLFALPDFLVMGGSTTFWTLTAYRGATAVVLLAAAFALRARPHLAPPGRLAMGLELAGFPFFFLYLLLRPELRATTLGMIMVVNLSLFVFVPGRVALGAWVAAGGIAGTVATLLFMGSGGENLPGLVMLLSLPAVVGFISANRLQRAQRQEFVVRTRLQQTNAALQEEIARSAELQAELRRQATTDPLTGLPNRREFDRCFARDAARADRDASPLCVAVFDLDHFKAVNDQYGHGAGDEVLRRVAQIARDCFRSVDSLGRIGGEEFAVLLPGAMAHDAAVVAQRFVDRLANTPIEHGGFTIHVTATVGVAERKPGESALDTMLHRADAALYEGKHAGRNRVEMAPPA